MLDKEAAALRADGDFEDRRQEGATKRTIDGERKCMQGQGQGQVVQRQDGNDNDGQPVPDADRRAAEWRRWRSSRYGRGGCGRMVYGALCIAKDKLKRPMR